MLTPVQVDTLDSIIRAIGGPILDLPGFSLGLGRLLPGLTQADVQASIARTGRPPEPTPIAPERILPSIPSVIPPKAVPEIIPAIRPEPIDIPDFLTTPGKWEGVGYWRARIGIEVTDAKGNVRVEYRWIEFTYQPTLADIWDAAMDMYAVEGEFAESPGQPERLSTITDIWIVDVEYQE